MANGKQWATKQERARLKDAVIATYGTVCHICGVPITKLTGKDPDSFSIDHVVARNAGGSSHDLLNLRPAHRICNIMKSDKDLADYAATHENAINWALSLK